MDLKQLILQQYPPSLGWPEADEAARICMQYVGPGSTFFATISYGIMLGKHLSRGGKGGVLGE